MTLYSTSTLEKIAERDCVDRLFREECLREKLATKDNFLKQAIKTGIVFDSLFLSGFGFSLYRFVDQLPDISAGYLALASLTGVITGLGTFSGAGMMGEREYYKTRFKNPDLEKGDNGFYLIDGKISSKGTVLEKAFGEKIKPYSSLEEFYNDKEKNIKYGFIDYLTVQNVLKYTYTKMVLDREEGDSYCPAHEFIKEKIPCVDFKLRRFHEIITINYYGTTPPADLMRVASSKKKFAILFDLPVKKNIKKDLNLSHIKVYYPHP